MNSMKLTKRILSILLAALLLFGAGLFVLAEEPEAEEQTVAAEPDWLSEEMTEFFDTASQEEINAYLATAFTPAPGENTTKYPLIFGAGAWHPLFINEEPWLPKSLVPGSKMDYVFTTSGTLGGDTESMDAIFDAVTSLDMDAFGDGLVQLWKNSYGPVAMDRNGESINPGITCVIPYLTYLGTKYSTFSGIPALSIYDATMNGVKVAAALGENKTLWTFDWRMDPWDNAGLLHDYFEKLIRLYGQGNSHPDGNHNGYSGAPFDKVNFNAISGSGPIALAYLKRYGTEYLASLCFNISMHNGSSLFGNIALGDFGFDASALKQGGLSMFGLQDSSTKDNPLADLGPVIEALYHVGILDGGLKVFNYAARGAYKKFYDEALIPIWFQMPCYLCMVPNDKYDQAKEFLFKNNSKYIKLLEKADRYQYDIMGMQDQLILDAASKIKVSVRLGYGNSLSPYAIGTNISSDELVDARYTSLGATCATPGTPFSKNYQQAIPGPAGKENCYVSPDRMVDASTCLLPDVTWFAKGLPHTPQWDYSGWYGWWLAAEDYTIWDNPNYPQYCLYTRKSEGESADHFTPLTAPEPSFLDLLLEFLFKVLAVWRRIVLLPLFWM